MGVIESFPPAKLIMGIISSPEYSPDQISAGLEASFGPVDYQSRVIPFDFTDYYRDEMGPDLYRFFLSFRNPVSPSELTRCKLVSDELERSFLAGASRRVNLDPGILTLHSLILASTKNHSHRIPLSEGIYGEVTLLYERGAFRDLAWTYPDYRTGEYKAILTDIRNIFRDQLKQGI